MVKTPIYVLKDHNGNIRLIIEFKTTAQVCKKLFEIYAKKAVEFKSYKGINMLKHFNINEENYYHINGFFNHGFRIEEK